MIGAGRVAAYEILTNVSSGRADLPTAVARVRRGLGDDRDRALATEISVGVQRWRAALDHLIVQFSKRRLERLDPEVVEILRLSIYQLLHLTRVPASAVVDDAVDLTRRAGKPRASGLVNAVLREISRNRQHLPLPGRPDDPSDRDRALDYLTITLSHPRWIAARWLDRCGFEAAEAWMRFNNNRAPLTLRANRLCLTPQDLAGRLAKRGIRVRPGAFASDALVVEQREDKQGREEGLPGLPGLPGLEDGWFVIQDEASQLVASLVTPPPGGLVLDVCAAPGGKTTAFAAALEGRGLVVACDVREKRVNLLRKTIAASRAKNVRLVQADLLRRAPFRSVFDVVFVDVPCSGLGTLRRDPDIRWRRRESDLASFAAAELTILQNAADVVKPGGRLIYATCSTEPEENEAVADLLLASTPDLVPVNARAVTARLPVEVVDERGHLRTQPHRHGLEAFFGAVFERRRL